MFADIKRLFRSQRERYLDAVERQFRKALGDIVDAIAERRDEERRIFREEGQIIFTNLMADVAQLASDRAGIILSFDIENLAVLDYLTRKAFIFASLVNDTTERQLRQQFREAIREGEGIESIRKRVQEVFKGTHRGEAVRARMIARTEATDLSNGGSHLTYLQNEDIVEQKEWLSSRDNRVRPTHTEADGQIQNLTDPFQVGDSLLRWPGDFLGSARERIRCRCVLLPIVVEN